jgi:hypothetical protein
LASGTLSRLLLAALYRCVEGAISTANNHQIHLVPVAPDQVGETPGLFCGFLDRVKAQRLQLLHRFGDTLVSPSGATVHQQQGSPPGLQ